MASPNIAADIEVADKTLLYLNAGGKLYSNSMYETSFGESLCKSYKRAIAPSRNWLDAALGYPERRGTGLLV